MKTAQAAIAEVQEDIAEVKYRQEPPVSLLAAIRVKHRAHPPLSELMQECWHHD
jgi:hypothetical protein